MEARVVGEQMERSIAGQVEFWAQIGKRAEALLRGRDVVALRRTEAVRAIQQGLGEAGTADGKKRLQEYLNSRPLPHFLPHPTLEDVVIRVDKNGKQTTGRLEGRTFVPLASRRVAVKALPAMVRKSKVPVKRRAA